ncbi:hypothetical protein AURDEDRAFT_115381 [Auricularia subglabra TFB-10046 SS5]|nr:hypothetical protein AURDEDRAFT_115381 [Auricularia subglabra TFB-10046 SS5]
MAPRNHSAQSKKRREATARKTRAANRSTESTANSDTESNDFDRQFVGIPSVEFHPQTGGGFFPAYPTAGAMFESQLQQGFETTADHGTHDEQWLAPSEGHHLYQPGPSTVSRPGVHSS